MTERVARLIEEMRAAVVNKRPINLSEPAHREITEALHVLVYEVQPSTQAGSLKVTYGDGPDPRGLPVHCLRPVSDVRIDERVALQVGTLSFRHLDYDERIDLYLVRDRETRGRTAGEIDELAETRMRELLDDPTLRRPGSQVIVYQAGLEPLAVGMYRAVIEHLMERRRAGLPPLAVQPIYYVDDQNRLARGPVWA